MKKLLLYLSMIVSPWCAYGQGSVIFLHPDGTGLGHWNAGRLLAEGPDGMLNWDRLNRLAAYRPHQKGWLSSTSHAGATVHAYGKKVHPDSYGMDKDQPIESASGHRGSLMKEAMEAGIRCGIVNSGHVGEPGTGVFLASSPSRGDKTGIAEKVVLSGADVIFCGGEIFMLPKGVKGVHGRQGVREDGRHLLEEARGEGYTVIFTRAELLNLPPDTEMVLGVFASTNTYNDKTEQDLAMAKLPTYDPDAPTVAEMTGKALEILTHDPERRFFLVAEEEGTDNFSNKLNAAGMLDAVLRADAAIGVALEVMESQPDRNILTLVGSDSDAGHPSIWAPWQLPPGEELPPHTPTGAALDGREGSESVPFLSKPDAMGVRHAFGIAWPYRSDMPGSVVNKAHGYRDELLKSTVDNRDIFHILHKVLFSKYDRFF